MRGLLFCGLAATLASACAVGRLDVRRHTEGQPVDSQDPFDVAPFDRKIDAALDFRTQLIQDGKILGPGPNGSEDVYFDRRTPAGKYVLRVSARCQQSFDVPVEVFGDDATTRVVLRVPLPSPLRRWTRDGTKAERVSVKETVTLPRNLEVEQVRTWPEVGSTVCDKVVVRPVEPVAAARKGDLLIVSVSQLSDVRLDGPTAAEAARAREAEEQAARARARAAEEAAARAARDKEVETGRCDPARYASLQQAVGAVRNYFEEVLRGQAFFYFVGHETVVATPQGTPVVLRAGARGEYHLFAIGFDDVALAAVDAKGYEVQQQSFWEPGLRAWVRSASISSRVTTARTRDQIPTRVTGNGCVAVVAVEQ